MESLYQGKVCGGNPMNIAVFSDIHGNYIAFQACLDEALKRNADRFLFLGDYLGEFAYPRRTLEMLYRLKEKYPCHFIRGNKEDYWLNRRRDTDCDWKNGNHSVYNMIYNYEHLTERDLDFFESLPICREVRFEGFPSLLLCHGSPADNREKLVLSGHFREIVDGCGQSCILCGHTHIQQLVEYGGKRVLNPGAVGVALHSREGKAQFMILRSEGGGWEHEFLSVDYDGERVVRDLHESGIYEISPYWCRITEHLVRTGEVPHGEVLARVIKDCEAETGACRWYDIPDQYWARAVDEMIGD